MVAPTLNVSSVLAAAFVLIFVVAAPGAIGPENVLVLYNQASPDGAQVASYYAGVHGIPEDQLLGLDNLGLAEVISADDYLNVIRPQVLSALDPSIDVIVTTKGLPLRIVNSHVNPNPPYPWNKFSSLESELARVDSISTWVEMGDQDWLYGGSSHLGRNPYYRAGDLDEPGDAAFDCNYGIRLTSRLDGFTLADITASIDRAQQAFVGPFHFVVDDDLGQSLVVFDRMEALANEVLEPSGVPYTYDPADPDDPTTDTFVTDAPGPVLGYVSYGAHGGGKPAPDGYLVDEVDGLTFDLANGAVFHTWESYNAYTFVEGGNRSGQGLVAEWIARGGTAGTGHVEEPLAHPANVTNEDRLFEMLLDGYTWAEAAWNATQQLSFVNTVVGDPLMVFRELIPGDANMDGNVDWSDFNDVSRNYTGSLYPGTGDKTWEQGDFDADGDVDFGDFNNLANNYTSGHANRVAPTPEPSTVVLLSMGVVSLLACAWCNHRRA